MHSQLNQISLIKKLTGGWLVMAIFLLGLVAVPSTPASAAPDNSPVEIKAVLGWQGKAVPGRYAPAVVELKNNGRTDLAGEIQAVNFHSYVPPLPPGSAPGTKQPPRFYPASGFGEKVSLPAGGEKKVILWFQVTGSGDRVDFVFYAEGREVARITQKVPATVTRGPMLGAAAVLGQIPPAMERVRLVMHDGVPRSPQVIQLTGELFPYRGDELNAFRYILVTGQGASLLDEEQRRALAEWVRAGGQLLVSGGLEIKESLAALPEETIELRVGEIAQQSNWQAAAGWLGRDNYGSAAPVAQISGGEPWGPGSKPLGSRFFVGQGSIIVLGFDANQPPWTSGALGEGLWQRVLAPSDQEKYDPYITGYQLGNLVHNTNNLPSDAFPGWRPVGSFLLAFLLLAAPGLYFLLRRMRRPEYTWVAVPALAVVFAGMVYLYMLQSGGNILINVVQVLDNRSGTEPAGYTALGYFAPTRPDFEAVLDNPDGAVQVQLMGGLPPEMMDETDSPPYSVIKGSDLTVRFSESSQWNMRSLAFRDDKAAAILRDMQVTVTVQGDKMTGTVQNNSDLHLDHATFLFGSDYKMLGDLQPGGEATVEMEVNTPRYNPQGNYGPAYPEPYRVFMYPDGPPAQPKPGEPAPPPPNKRLTSEEQRRMNMMENWQYSVVRRGPVETGWPLSLLAWSDDPAGDPGIKGIKKQPYYLTMLVLQPEIKLTPGPFVIPAGLVVPEVIDSQVRGVYGHNNLIGLDGGMLDFAFKPQLGPDITVTEVKLNLPYYPTQNQNQGMGPPAAKPVKVPAGVLEVFQPGQGAWKELSGSETFTLTGDYISAGGEVRVRVNGGNPNAGTGFYFLAPTVEYGGEKA